MPDGRALLADQTDIRFTIELSEAQRALVSGLGTKALPEALAALAPLALLEWIEWLAADDRPASLTELSKRRVKALINAGLLPPLPTAPVIAQRARLTLGQARYITSTLALESPAASAGARRGLAEHIRASLVSSGILKPDEMTEAKITELATDAAPDLKIDAPREEGELVLALHEELLNERYARTQRLDIAGFQPPTLKRRTDSYVTMTIRRHVAVTVLQRLHAETP